MTMKKTILKNKTKSIKTLKNIGYSVESPKHHISGSIQIIREGVALFGYIITSKLHSVLYLY